MEKKRNELAETRIVAGFSVAWAVSVCIAFLAGGIYAIFMTYDAAEMVNGIVSGDKEAWQLVIFVGTATAVTGAVVAFLTIVLIALPMYLASTKLKHVTLRLYMGTGLLIALIVSGILLALQRLIYDFPGSGLWFPFAAIIISGPIATLTFWIVARPESSAAINTTTKAT